MQGIEEKDKTAPKEKPSRLSQRSQICPQYELGHETGGGATLQEPVTNEDGFGGREVEEERVYCLGENEALGPPEGLPGLKEDQAKGLEGLSSKATFLKLSLGLILPVVASRWHLYYISSEKPGVLLARTTTERKTSHITQSPHQKTITEASENRGKLAQGQAAS
ncbi:hypothetical protein MJT46_010364 [Ovis ammon polii x Ovis aries]|nr:hypothetical protein MJT46_010364 [Ovis ammon polii x Ovis aries]